MESLIIGIAGGSGSGKSTFTNRIKQYFGDEKNHSKKDIIWMENQKGARKMTAIIITAIICITISYLVTIENKERGNKEDKRGDSK